MEYSILEYTPFEPVPRRQLTILATFADVEVAEAAQRIMGLRHPDRYFMMVPKNLKEDEDPGGITPGPPVLASLSPESAVLGTDSFDLHVFGEGFTPESVIYWNNSPEPTTFVSPTELTTGVNMSTAHVATEIPVSVGTADAIGRGIESDVLIFTFIEPPPPTITQITPEWCRPAASQFTLLVNGSGFQEGAAICLDGVPYESYLTPDGLGLTTLFDPDYPATPEFTIAVTVKGHPNYVNASNALPLLVTSDPAVAVAQQGARAAKGAKRP